MSPANKMTANSPVSIPAHFDGERILLDEPVELEQNARLVVTILPSSDTDREAWLRLSLNQLNAAYDGEGDDYPLASIKEMNPDYEGSDVVLTPFRKPTALLRIVLRLFSAKCHRMVTSSCPALALNSIKKSKDLMILFH